MVSWSTPSAGMPTRTVSPRVVAAGVLSGRTCPSATRGSASERSRRKMRGSAGRARALISAGARTDPFHEKARRHAGRPLRLVGELPIAVRRSGDVEVDPGVLADELAQ